MSLNLNRVMLAGNLTRDPVLKDVGTSKVASFAIAINRKFKAADGTKREEVTFVDIDAWGTTAELIAKWFTKGQGILVEGRLKLEGWETQAGEKRQKIKVVADHVHFTTGKTDRPAPASETPASVSAPADDEPPF